MKLTFLLDALVVFEEAVASGTPLIFNLGQLFLECQLPLQKVHTDLSVDFNDMISDCLNRGVMLLPPVQHPANGNL